MSLTYYFDSAPNVKLKLGSVIIDRKSGAMYKLLTLESQDVLTYAWYHIGEYNVIDTDVNGTDVLCKETVNMMLLSLDATHSIDDYILFEL